MSARFSWKLWNGTGATPTELALMRGHEHHGFVWQIPGERWAFGVKRRDALSEAFTRHDAQRRLLTHAKWLLKTEAALSPLPTMEAGR